MQEKLLTLRVVHFLHGELIWKCSQAIVSEKSPYDKVAYQLPPVYPRWGRLEHQFTQEIQFTDIEERYWHLHYIWRDVVESYTRCQLTKPGNKLVAISALAKKLGAQLQEQ
jgi:hypothetical protein